MAWFSKNSNDENPTIAQLEQDVQALYDIPLQQFTPENVAELNRLQAKVEDMGYDSEVGDIYNIRFEKK